MATNKAMAAMRSIKQRQLFHQGYRSVADGVKSPVLKADREVWERGAQAARDGIEEGQGYRAFTAEAQLHALEEQAAEAEFQADMAELDHADLDVADDDDADFDPADIDEAEIEVIEDDED